MKNLYHLFKREFYTFKNMYINLQSIKIILILFLLTSRLFITNNIALESIDFILYSLLFIMIAITFPLIVTASLINDRSKMKDIKLLPIHPSLYILIKYFLILVLPLVELLLFSLLNVEEFLVLIFLAYLYISPIISLILVFYLVFLNNFVYRFQLLVLTIVLHVCAAVITYFSIYINGTGLFSIYSFLIGFSVSIISLVIWGVVFDKNSEI